jgi:hypothetical protein
MLESRINAMSAAMQGAMQKGDAKEYNRLFRERSSLQTELKLLIGKLGY